MFNVCNPLNHNSLHRLSRSHRYAVHRVERKQENLHERGKFVEDSTDDVTRCYLTVLEEVFQVFLVVI
jgi:hypothetical protein